VFDRKTDDNLSKEMTCHPASDSRSSVQSLAGFSVDSAVPLAVFHGAEEGKAEQFVGPHVETAEGKRARTVPNFDQSGLTLRTFLRSLPMALSRHAGDHKPASSSLPSRRGRSRP
jgi:hypothetical protein